MGAANVQQLWSWPQRRSKRSELVEHLFEIELSKESEGMAPARFINRAVNGILSDGRFEI
jgi:hypothetical protein